jgi:hypothetical protein
VLLDKQPLAGAIVTLYPQGVAEPHATPSKAQTDTTGRFRVGTFADDDGAPAGEYVITVIRYPVQKQGDGGYTAGPNDVPKKYASPKTTDLRVHLDDGKTDIPTLALVSEKANKKKSATYSPVFSE